MLEHTLHRVCTTYVNDSANAAADRVAINAIVNEAADATADRINADSTIVDEAADAKADRVAVNATSSMRWHTPLLVEFPPSPMWQGVSSEHEQIITAVANLEFDSPAPNRRHKKNADASPAHSRRRQNVYLLS